jgi:RES domain-containing protein
MPVGWRIVKSARAATAFDGEGARLWGGRWNSPGLAVIYTAENVSLAALELLVHLQESAAALVTALEAAELPARWHAYPAPPRLRELGDAWLRGLSSAVLAVPSAVVPAERNYLLNPAHPDFRRVTPGAPQRFAFDRRLAKRS